jgi:acetyltransferase-like isoleucine patch superfamily enzyme
MTAVSPHAIVERGAKLGDDASVGPFSIIHSGVTLGPGSRVGSHCSIGIPSEGEGSEKALDIGPNATIRSHTVIYSGSTIGPRLETGHRVTIREGLVAGINLRVGINSEIQGTSTFGDYVRLHSGVFTCKTCTLGDHVWLFPHVVFTDDPHPPNDENMQGPTVEDYAVIGAQSCVAPGVRIGHGAVVGAASMVTRDVGPEMLALGVPAREIGPASDIQLRDGSGRPAYPWTQHFRRGYPEEVTAQWD